MKYFWKVVLVFLVGAIPVGAKEYSFTQAYERVLNTDESLAAARAEAKALQAQKSSARGLYYPSIGVKGTYTRINAPISIDLNGIRSAVQPLYPASVVLPSFDMQVQDEHFFKAQAYATFSIYTGGKIASANAAASANYAGSVAQIDVQANNLLVELARKYFGKFLADETVSVRKLFLQNARQNAQDAAKMFHAGTISKVEKMAVDVILAQARRDYTSSLNDAQMAQTLLKSLLSQQEDIQTSSSLFVVPLEQMPTLQEFQHQALDHNPALSVLNSKANLSLANEKAQKADFFPSVYLFGQRELHTHDLTLLEPDWAYGVGVAWNLFEGGQNYHKTKAAQEETRRIEELKAQLTKDITTGIEYYYKKMQNAQETYTALQEELAFTEAFYKARQLGFKAGTATSLEVNMALSQWQKTQLDYLKAQYDFVTSLAAILNLSGQTNLFGVYAQGANK